ncbi:MAG: hypothetical protein PHG44_02320 [Lentisphaeria bacterium]|mgnify:CR=1 FL=1|jgi:hypothetical protein|nr:hypothetical protein [Lentisphaeria bacterium]NLZ60140.1 hypothetical protein [Lentisphaerota bacterium]
MKSAYELAMERLGGNTQQLSNEQKELLAEVDREFEAKLAQAKFAAQDRRKKAQGDPEKNQEIQEDLELELRSIQVQKENRKEKMRQGFNQE